MGVSIEFTRDSYSELQMVIRDLDRLAVGLRSYRRLFGLIRDSVLIPYINKRFQYGKFHWKPITDFSARTRRVQPAQGKYGPTMPLIDTGKLWRRAIEKKRFFIDASEGFMEYGNWTDTPYGRKHNLGGHSDRGNEVPERSFTALDSRAIQKVDGVFQEWVYGQVRQLIGERNWRQLVRTHVTAREYTSWLESLTYGPQVEGEIVEYAN